MNKYTQDGNHIIDATRKLWSVDTPHPLPLPEGIEQGHDNAFTQILYGPSVNGGRYWSYNKAASNSHWLARRPLPPVPSTKTQGELDHEAFVSWHAQFPNCKYSRCLDAFKAGIAHGRSNPSK